MSSCNSTAPWEAAVRLTYHEHKPQSSNTPLFTVAFAAERLLSSTLNHLITLTTDDLNVKRNMMTAINRGLAACLCFLNTRGIDEQLQVRDDA